MSIGQEISVTALQLVASFAAVANDGRLMQPQIVRAVLDAQGREARGFEPQVIRQAIAPDTARVLTGIMTRVVSEGTGHNAAIAGFDVAGKTGTAQKLDPATRRYSRAPGVLSFVGFVPASDPRLALLVMLDEPKNEKWGSEAAAPIFAAIGREALRHLQVQPRDSAPIQIVRSEGAAAAGPVATVLGTAGPIQARARTAAFVPDAEGPSTMPSLLGLSLRQAMEELAPTGVAVEIAGRGIVIAQSPPPGAPLPEGMPCLLTLASPAAGR